jgi:hypothetical protein
MLIDCDTCAARDYACGECVIGVLLRAPAVPSAPASSAASVPVELDDAEQAAIGSLAGAGLVPPLRLVRAISTDTGDPGAAYRGIA